MAIRLTNSLYHCYYTNHRLGKTERVVTERLSDVADGFWVNEEYNFTKGSDCKFWIPASVIQYVEKVV